MALNQLQQQILQQTNTEEDFFSIISEGFLFTHFPTFDGSFEDFLALKENEDE